jgi:nitrite reductase (NADH) small subunit/3-phenylpropionate/trans-cinnamate dioxygenase ferredoxin subunit
VTEPVRVASLDEIAPGQPTLIDVGGARVVLVRLGDAVYACGDVCAHKGGPLSEGRLSGSRLACPWHGWTYDVRTGQCVFPGRGARVPSYTVRLEGREVWLEAP